MGAGGEGARREGEGGKLLGRRRRWRRGVEMAWDCCVCVGMRWVRGVIGGGCE